MAEAQAAVCPKCGTARDNKPHCAKCGLAAVKMADFAKTRDDIPDALGVAWKAAVEKWDDGARHDEVLRLVTKHDAYAWAATRYRERMKEQPTDKVAAEQLERVRKAAEATLLTTATRKPEPEPYRNTMALLGLLIIIIIAGLVYAVARGSGDPVPPRRTLPQAETK